MGISDPWTESHRKSSVETAFVSQRHHLMVRKAQAFEITNYQNLSFNAHDQKSATGAYPHASANVETRDDSVFLPRMRLMENMATDPTVRIRLLLGASISKPMLH